MPSRLLYDTVRRKPPGPDLDERSALLGPAALDRLQASLVGRLIRQGDSDYRAARRVFNRAVRTRPAAIANCAGADDVAACLAFAQAEDVAFRIRGGGHGFSGLSMCEGLVIDVSLLDDITLDQVSATAVVGGGCAQGRLGDLLAQAGLHLPLGDWPSVGIGGFMQGGGYGLTARSFGMNLDHVQAVRVMLADGRIVMAEPGRNHDLWWAVRGGAGNFGVVLDITYRLHRDVALAEAALAWKLDTPAERRQAADALALIQSGFARGSPQTSLFAMATFGLDPGDASMRGPWLIVSAIHVGPEQAMNAALAPLRALPGTVQLDYARLKRNGDIPALRRQSRYVARPVPASDWAAMLDLLAEAPDDHATLYVQTVGGAVAAVARETSAFVHRAPDLLVFMDVFWNDVAGRAAQLAFQDRWTALVAPLVNGHSYQNFPDPALDDHRAAYWGDALPALVAVKRKYDPTGTFRSPQMVSPHPGQADPVAVWPPQVIDALRRPIAP